MKILKIHLILLFQQSNVYDLKNHKNNCEFFIEINSCPNNHHENEKISNLFLIHS